VVTKFTKLFEPGRIGRVQTKNRIIMAPMGTLSCDMEGYATDRTIEHYVRRAKGGAGLIIVETTIVDYHGGPPAMCMEICDDKFIPGLRKLSEAIRRAGSIPFLQLNHLGSRMLELRQSWPNPSEIDVVGPSPVPWSFDGQSPRELSREEISRYVTLFAEGTRRAKEAGFDGVEFHGAHGYFMHGFLSPFHNKRTDEYGGSAENRARFVCEVLAASRERVGPDFPLILRVSGMEHTEGGVEIGDVVRQAPLFVDSGADALHISASGMESDIWQMPNYMHPDGTMVHLADAVKKVVGVPVIAVGKLGKPAIAERVLQEGKADFIAVGRPLLADADWANKVREGRTEDINHCITCNNCIGSVFEIGWKRLNRYGCTVNPALLRDKEMDLTPAELPKKVMVIGGGLAGMQAAVDLARRGHQVSLYEKSDKLGGQWNIACMQQGKAGFASLTEYLKRGLKKAGVNIMLNSEVTPSLVRKARPDAVVVATGASPATLDVPGANGKNVVQAVDVITEKAPVGERVVVIGGRYLGMEVAISLAEQGKKVSLVTRSLLGRGVEKSIYQTLVNKLIENGVYIYPNSPLYEIRENGVHAVYKAASYPYLLFFKADTVVLATGYRSENGLVEELKNVIPEVYAIGDCIEPRHALEAMEEGADIARKI